MHGSGGLAQNAPLNVWAQVLTPHASKALDDWTKLGWHAVVSPLVHGCWRALQRLCQGCNASNLLHGEVKCCVFHAADSN